MSFIQNEQGTSEGSLKIAVKLTVSIFWKRSSSFDLWPGSGSRLATSSYFFLLPTKASK